MAVVPVQCPTYQSFVVVKYGKQPNGTQRHQCQTPDCSQHPFQLTYYSASPSGGGQGEG
jgi:hypothetical protein